MEAVSTSLNLLDSIVDGSFIEAPSSTKNADKKRDPEMRSAKNLNFSQAIRRD